MIPARCPLALAAFVASAAPLVAETDFLNLTEAERQIFHAEIREVFLANPDLATPPDPSQPTVEGIYAGEVADDLALIAAHAQALFGTAQPERDIAFFTAPDCAECDTALAELRVIAQGAGWTVHVIDMAQEAALAQAFGFDSAPNYILPKMMLRGAMPAIALERYLAP